MSLEHEPLTDEDIVELSGQWGDLNPGPAVMSPAYQGIGEDYDDVMGALREVE